MEEGTITLCCSDALKGIEQKVWPALSSEETYWNIYIYISTADASCREKSAREGNVFIFQIRRINRSEFV